MSSTHIDAAAHSSIENFCERLPKIELHAHLNGCIRPSTLDELLQENKNSLSPDNNQPTPQPTQFATSLSDAFVMFDNIHRAVTTTASLRRIVAESIEDFSSANVMYVELRTTPRPLADMADKRAYVETVVAAIQENAPKFDMLVRLLLSINRSQSLETAMDTVRLAAEFSNSSMDNNSPPCVVGVDFSGNPHIGSFDMFKPVFEEARRLGLKTAIHFAEHHDPVEAESIMNFKPDRLGHAVCLSDSSFARLHALRLPVELCLTSNIITVPELGTCSCCASLVSTTDPNPYSNARPCLAERICAPCNGLVERVAPCLCGYQSHPLRSLVLDDTFPMCVCTDDTGVFGNSNVLEFVRAAHAFSLSRQQLVGLVRRSIPMVFDVGCVQALSAAVDSFATLECLE